MRAETGRRLWAELHGRAAQVSEQELAGERTWLAGFEARLPCGDCKQHWRRMLAELPPPLESRLSYARWTWAVHNVVNRHLGKPQPAYADVAELYGWPPEPSPDGSSAGVRSDCEGASNDR